MVKASRSNGTGNGKMDTAMGMGMVEWLTGLEIKQWECLGMVRLEMKQLSKWNGWLENLGNGNGKNGNGDWNGEW